MDVNKNSYTFMFAAIMVVVVAALLSFAATSLKPYQDENERLEKMQSILSSIKVEATREEAAELYPKYIVQELVVSNHEEKPGIEAFNVDLTKEVRKSNIEREAPLYIAEKDGVRYFVIPIRGTGLWGPIWGYVSLQEDISTLYGAVFDHQGETPGLGAEIADAAFENQFQGKEILDDSGNLIGIDVRKGDASSQYQVDGISGGTITSEGVEAMILDCLESYISFLKEHAAIYSTAGSEL